MFLNKRILIAATMMLALSLVAGTANAGYECRKVNAKVVFLSDVFETPDVCNAFQYCQYWDIKGFPKGRLWGYWNDGDETVVFGDTFVLSASDVFETKDGDIFAEERGMVNFYATEGYVAHFGIIGGTGKFDGAVGWMAATVLYVTDTGGSVRGEICGPYIRG